MASPNIIPACTMLRGTPLETVAIIESISNKFVKGNLHYNGGIGIPFETEHDHYSFKVGHGPRFYFGDWVKLK